MDTLYFFIINGRKDFSHVLPDLEEQLSHVDVPHEIYVTKGEGDGTRVVRMYCEFHEKEDVCFVACGGSGTVVEVAAGVVGKEGKRMAMMTYGTSNDLAKHFPGRDFKSVKALLDAETIKMDIIKCNGDYSLNVVNLGFDSLTAYYTNINILFGAKNPYRNGLIQAIFTGRYNNYKVVADGERVSKGLSLLCVLANASYCGNQFKCGPRARIDDGLMDLTLFRGMPLLSFLMVLPHFIKGDFLENKFCLRRLVYRQVKHVEVSCRDLMYVSLDGEILASTRFVFDVIPKAVEFVLPKLS